MPAKKKTIPTNSQANSRAIPTHFTEQQKNFIQAVAQSKRHLYLRATAGAGKTSTIKEAAWHVGPEKRNGYFVYNRAAKEHLGPGLPNHVQASTIHADGLATLTEGHKSQVMTDTGKSLRLARTLFDTDAYFWSRIWDKAREQCLDEHSPADQLFDLCGLTKQEDDEQNAEILLGIQAVLIRFRQASLNDWHVHHTPDFTDLLWLPLQLGIGKKKYDNLFVDEAQDLTPLRQAYIKHVLGIEGKKKSGRLYLIADPDQSIYQYSGASPRVLEHLAWEVNALEYPLSVSWRCPRNLVALAKQFSPFIQAAPNAKEGSIEHHALKDITFTPSETVLCRLNAPLIKLALQLLGQNVSIDYRGRNLSQTLKKYALAAFGKESHPLDSAYLCLTEVHRTEQHQLEKRDDLDVRERKRKTTELSDLFDCLHLITERSQEKGQSVSYQRVCGIIDQLCHSQGDILLSTVHQAKGSEWASVTLLHPELMPMTNGDPDEERCIQFVALTRSKDRLRLAYGKEVWESGKRFGPHGWQISKQPSPEREHILVPASMPAKQLSEPATVSQSEQDYLATAQRKLEERRQLEKRGELYRPERQTNKRVFTPLPPVSLMTLLSEQVHENDLQAKLFESPSTICSVSDLTRLLKLLAMGHRPNTTAWAKSLTDKLSSVPDDTNLHINHRARKELGEYAHYSTQTLRPLQQSENGPKTARVHFLTARNKSWDWKTATIISENNDKITVTLYSNTLVFLSHSGEIAEAPFSFWRPYLEIPPNE